MKLKMEANISTDVLAEILSRLPAKCVWRLRSVCKDWKSLIEAPSFADLHFRRGSKEEDEVFMFWSDERYRDGTTRFYSIDYKDGKAVRAVEQEFSLPAPTKISPINGLVCYHGTDYEIKVCNPLTRETITLPKPSFLSSSKSPNLGFGIGFDSTSNTYKVLATSCLVSPQVEIFTLEGRTKGWRKLQLPSQHLQFYFKGGFYANGCAFWVTYEYNGDEDDRDVLFTLMTFNFAQEKFEMFPYPPDIDQIGCPSIHEVGGRGCLIETKEKTRMMKLWTLTPVSSSKQVWVHHHTLLPRYEKSPTTNFPHPKWCNAVQEGQAA